MTTENVLYTDGHEVTVTDSFLQIRKKLYLLKGITKHGFLIIYPDRFPVLIAMTLGAMLIAMGSLRLVPSSLGSIQIYSLEIGTNAIVLAVGILIALASSIVMGLMKERYAVRIATAEGEKNVLVSPRKEYVTQIVDALNRAIMSVLSKPRR